MFTVRFLIGALFAACFCLGNYDNALASHNFSAPELKPVSGSYKIAKSTFLPDADGDLGLSGHSISKYDHNYGDNCAAYPLTSCPDGGICASCPFNLTQKRLVSCKSGFEKSGSSCVASSCGAINSSYKDSIPTNQICTKFTEDGKTCYKDCKDVSCSGYNLSCNAPIPNVGGMKKCSDCESASANCNLCRIDFCNYGYKINGKGNGCVELSDECVNGYYKSCETGIHSTGLPTEKGTPCYKCKALDDNCPSGYTKQSCVNGYSATSTTEAGSTCYLCNATDRPCDCAYTYNLDADFFNSEGFKVEDCVCVYSDEAGENFCVGPQCSETEYPEIYETNGGIEMASCMLASKHNKWAETRTCSYDTCVGGDENCTLNNEFCDYYMGCNNNEEYSYTCTEQDADGSVTSFKIAGDFEKYACPEYFNCVYDDTTIDMYGRCEIAGDFNESLKTLVNAACPNISSGADARLVVFYKDENNDDVYYLKSELNEQSNIHNSTCYNPEYGNCPLKTVLTGWADNNSEWQSCNLWNYYWSDDKQQYDQSGYLMNRQKKYIYSEGVVEFCQMKYCAIQLYDQASDTASVYGVNEEVATIVNTVVGPNISETNPFYIYLWRVDSINDYYNGTGVFEPNTKYRSCDAENDPECRTFAISTYLNKPGGCVGYTIDNYGSKTETRIITSDATSTVGTNKLMYIYRFFYNPNTIEAHRNNTIVSKTVDTNNDCYHRLIKGKTFCNHQSTYMYSCDGCGSDRATIKPPVGFSC